jgi:branched-subunit amino acid aminotransferase/4-amino-4-deoxychorismate lyase
MAVIADAKANPLDPTAGHKTLNYWWRLRELQTAAGRGAGEAIVLQVSNHVCGGCVSNLFAVKDGTLVTPIARGEEQEVGGKGAIPSPVLPGITRARVLKEAKKMGLTVERRMMGIGDVLDADEVFLTNSSWGVLPVTSVEAEPIAAGTVGAVSRALRERVV